MWQVKLVCVCCSGGGNWCRQDPKWLFSCLTEDKREKNIYKQGSKIAGEKRGVGTERRGEESQQDENKKRRARVEVDEGKSMK